MTQSQIDNLAKGRVKGLKKPGAGFPKGHVPFSKGTKGLLKANRTSFKKGSLQGVQFKKGEPSVRLGVITSTNDFLRNHVNEYKALHKRINRRFVKLHVCEKCGKEGRTEWANKENKYLEIREDWMELCRSCHSIYDKVNIPKS